MTQTAAQPATQSAATTGAAPGPWRRHRSTLLVAGGLLVALVVAIVVGTGTSTSTPMDPDNPGPDGTQALSRVLQDQGVDVEVARGADALEATPVDAATTVVVVAPYYLGVSTVERLLDHSAGAAQLVVVAAGPGISDEFGVPGGGSQVALSGGRDADCDDPLFTGLRLQTDGATVYRGGDCFPGSGGAVVVRPDEGTLLFGADEALTNDQVLRADNAAVALRLLGQTERLVWYVPDPADLVGDDGVSLQTLLPRWIQPALVLGLLALLLVVVWRGRRFGALATEPLPVVVRAAETTRSLGRLYRRSGDRQHAAESLRRAARARLAERLRLGSTTAPDVVVREVARRTDRREDAVAALLGPDGDVPSSDRDLIHLADQLAELDREVRRT